MGRKWQRIRGGMESKEAKGPARAMGGKVPMRQRGPWGEGIQGGKSPGWQGVQGGRDPGWQRGRWSRVAGVQGGRVEKRERG